MHPVADGVHFELLGRWIQLYLISNQAKPHSPISDHDVNINHLKKLYGCTN